MPINELKGKIRVYNYEMSPVGFPSEHDQKGVFIRGRNEDEEFVMERVAYDDIEAENGKSDLFKVGRLRFHPEEEDEIYDKLEIDGRENIKSEKELIEYLQEDSIENIKKISEISSTNLISRMKSTLFAMERSGMSVPPKIVSVVNERNDELKYGGKRNINSPINKLLTDDSKQKEDNKLKETVNALAKKLESLEKEKQEKDDSLEKSQNAIKDLLAIVEQLKKENSSVQDKKETSKKTNKK